MSFSAVAPSLKRPANLHRPADTTCCEQEAEFECTICCDVLLDPVVAPLCGHDFCKVCYDAWIHTNSVAGTPAACPLCRCGPLPPMLAICLRLRDMVERARPSDVKRRRHDAAPAPDTEGPTSRSMLLPVPGWPVATQGMLAAMAMAMHAAVPGAAQPAWQYPGIATAWAHWQQEQAAAAPEPSNATAAAPAPCEQPVALCITGGTSAPTPEPTPSAADWHTSMGSNERLGVARAIIRVLMLRSLHKALGTRLPDAVRLLELMLFRAAPSCDAYLNPLDLEARIAAAVRARLEAARARRERLAAAAPAATAAAAPATVAAI